MFCHVLLVFIARRKREREREVSFKFHFEMKEVFHKEDRSPKTARFVNSRRALRQDDAKVRNVNRSKNTAREEILRDI